MIVADALTVGYGARPAISDVSFTVESATSCALVGPNGSGKTTLLHAIAGLRTPMSGRLSLGPGSPLVALVSQRHDRRRWLPLTVDEVLDMGCYQRRGLISRLTRQDRDAIAAATHRMEIADIVGEQFDQLSGGQQQRVLLAQALVRLPEILLLDEPITGLDLASQERILDVVAEETRRGTTVLLATHNLDEARHADQVMLLAGHLVAIGSPDDVLTPEYLASAYAGRLLGDHADHDHDHTLLVIDDHGHGTHDR